MLQTLAPYIQGYYSNVLFYILIMTIWNEQVNYLP